MLRYLRAIFAGLVALGRGEADILHELDEVISRLVGIHAHLVNLERLTMSNQDEINSIATRLGAILDGLRGDVQNLKDQVAAGTPAEQLDFSAVDERLSGLETLDAETPAVDAPVPTDPNAPVDPAL